MNREEIIRMAGESWLTEYGVKELAFGRDVEIDIDALEQFAALVAAAERERNTKEFPVQFGSVKAWEDWCKAIRENEREACAKVVDENAAGCLGLLKHVLKANANAIRRRSKIDSIVQNERSARGNDD
jgi:hypothetical protein